MMEYLNASGSDRQVGFVGDPLEACELHLFADADHAGDRRDCKSTSGVYLCLWGPNTRFPLACICKKQTSQSHSSVEAELVALDLALRKPLHRYTHRYTCGEAGESAGS